MPNARSVSAVREVPSIDKASVRDGLLEKRRQLLKLYRHDLQVGQEASNDGTEDLVDRANNSYNRELMFSLSDTERRLMFLIDDALLRLDDGSFGVCAHCDEVIVPTRLEAVPWARYCVRCQQLEEEGMLDG